MRKNVYGLRALRKVMQAANERYLVFIAAIGNPDAGSMAIDKVARPIRDGDRSYRGFNLFLGDDHSLFLTLARGEWCISGFRAAGLGAHLPRLTPSRCSSLLKRLHAHGLIEKAGHRNKYYLTRMGRRILVTVLNIRESMVLPSLCKEVREFFVILSKISSVRDYEHALIPLPEAPDDRHVFRPFSRRSA